MKIAALDIGGTHARLAIATLAASGSIDLDPPVTLKTSDYPGIEAAWHAFAAMFDAALPDAAAIAIAGPVSGGSVRMTNNNWAIDTKNLARQLGLRQITLLNDFAAVAHAAAISADDALEYLAGPDVPLPSAGTISVIGPGTGLGVAQIHRSPHGYIVQATEGGHIGFAPLDAIDDAIAANLRARHGRVSVERIVSGPGIVEILAALQDGAASLLDDETIWGLGMSGKNEHCAEAVERFCRCLGSAAGDYALAHGAGGVVIAGGLGYRLRHVLARSGFAESFSCKGRYESMMASIPVKLMRHSQPGLLGAAAAYAKEHLQ